MLGVATLLAWLGLGSLVLVRGPRVGDNYLDLLNRVGVGVIAFALLTFAAGWTRLLYPAAYRALFVAAALIGARELVLWSRQLPKPSFHAWPRWQRALLALLLVYVCIDLIAVSAPISSPDALLYHAADPRLFAQSHRIFEIPWNSSSYEPSSVEMLALDGLLLWNPVQGAFAPLLLALAALAAVGAFAYRVAGRSVALLASVIFFAQPFMVWEATSLFIETGIALMVALAAWNLFAFVRHSERGALVLAGVFAGGAAGMKYLGLIVALTLAVVLALLLLRRLSAQRALLFAIPAAAVALPWYAKNAILTGNPFYPHIFGGLNSSAAMELQYAMSSFGSGRSALDFALLPARLLADAKPFDGGEYLSPLFVIFGPVAALLLRGRAILIACAGVLLYLIAWFVTTQQARFLVPLMPVVAVLAALGIVALARESRLGRLLATTVTAAALTVGLGASTVYAAQFVPVLLGTQPSDEFLRQKVSNYHGVEWLNRSLGQNDRVATDVWALFYLRVPYTPFGTMGDLLPASAGPAATRAFVRRHGITDIAILDDNRARRRQVGYLRAHLIARVPVRSVQSRTRGHFGPRHDMLVYAIPGDECKRWSRRRPPPGTPHRHPQIRHHMGREDADDERRARLHQRALQPVGFPRLVSRSGRALVHVCLGGERGTIPAGSRTGSRVRVSPRSRTQALPQPGRPSPHAEVVARLCEEPRTTTAGQGTPCGLLRLMVRASARERHRRHGSGAARRRQQLEAAGVGR